MLTVHHLGISQSERIVWLCEELGIAYELKRYDRDAQTRLAPAEYKALHPIGTAPIISDGELVLPESGAIIEYIIRKYGNDRLILGPSHPEFANYLFWYHFANASMMPNLMMPMVLAMAGATGDTPILQALRARSTTALALADQRLGAVPYLAGQEFTAADLIMFFPLTTMRMFSSLDISDYPNLQAYLRRVGSRPAYQRARAKGDPGLPPKLD